MQPLTPAEFNGVFWYLPASERDKKWGIYVTSIGVHSVAAHQPYPDKAHPYAYDYHWKRGQLGRALPVYAITYISRGHGWLHLSSGRRPVEAGHVMLLFPGVWHRYGPDPEVGWDEHWVAFDGAVARRWMKECGFSSKQLVLKSRNEKALLEMYSSLIEIAQANPAALQQLLGAKVHAMLATIYSERFTELSGRDQASALVRKAQARMQAEFASNLDLKQLSRELGIGYRQFRELFLHQTGFSPHRYFVELRLAQARALLTQTGFSIKEVATRSGFADEYYFSRLFKARVGRAPTEWRATMESSNL